MTIGDRLGSSSFPVTHRLQGRFIRRLHPDFEIPPSLFVKDSPDTVRTYTSGNEPNIPGLAVPAQKVVPQPRATGPTLNLQPSTTAQVSTTTSSIRERYADSLHPAAPAVSQILRGPARCTTLDLWHSTRSNRRSEPYIIYVARHFHSPSQTSSAPHHAPADCTIQPAQRCRPGFREDSYPAEQPQDARHSAETAETAITVSPGCHSVKSIPGQLAGAFQCGSIGIQPETFPSRPHQGQAFRYLCASSCYPSTE